MNKWLVTVDGKSWIEYGTYQQVREKVLNFKSWNIVLIDYHALPARNL